MTPPHQAQSLLDNPIRQSAPKTPWVAVTGGKGGVGKTLLSVNLAIMAAKAGYRTLIADLDPGLANVDVHLRLAPKLTVEDLAEGTCSPKEAIVKGPAGISVLAGKRGSTALASGDPQMLARTMRAVESAARPYDLVICDTGAGIGPSVLATTRRASMILTVTTPDLAAATDAYALIKLMLREGHTTPHLAINRVKNRADAMQAATRLGSVCQKFLNMSVPLAGWLRDDAALETAVGLQRPFALDGHGTSIDELRALASAVLSCVTTQPRTIEATA